MPQKYSDGPFGPRIRHDWRLWIRHDIARWMKPGVDPADVIPALARERAQNEAKRAREEAARADEDAAFAAWIESERRWLAAINQEMDEVNAEMARWRRRLAEEAKYSPNQPRVPAGNSRGGQWTDGSTGGSIARPMGSSDGGDVSQSSELTPAEPSADEVQIAGGYPVDLLEERELGGHAIEGHLRSDRSLQSDLGDRVAEAVRKGDFVSDMRQGSFTSLEAANKLVNATIARNPDQVNRDVDGVSPKENLDEDFPGPTGREAVARTERSQIFIRDTYSVRVVIVPDGTVAKGFRVETAFPMNRKR
jgi:hypothetical protein